MDMKDEPIPSAAPKTTKELIERIRGAGGDIGTDGDDSYMVVLEVFDRRHFTDDYLKWMTRFSDFGGMDTIWIPRCGVTDVGCEWIARFPKLTHLSLDENAITDAGIRHVARLRHLEVAHLANTRISDTGASLFAKIPTLVELSVASTLVTDATVNALRGAKRLTHLYLDRCNLSDDCLGALFAAPQLEFVNLWHTGISRRGIEELRRRRPTTTVEYGPV